jgi:hypothetical protein
MLLGAGLILNWLIRHEHRSELGIHFSGLGLGLFACLMYASNSRARAGWSAERFIA